MINGVQIKLKVYLNLQNRITYTWTCILFMKVKQKFLNQALSGAMEKPCFDSSHKSTFPSAFTSHSNYRPWYLCNYLSTFLSIQIFTSTYHLRLYIYMILLHDQGCHTMKKSARLYRSFLIIKE